VVMSGATLYGTSAIRGPAGNGTIFSLELAAAPVISSVTKSNGVFALSWSANPGSTYQVQYSSDAVPTTWSNLKQRHRRHQHHPFCLRCHEHQQPTVSIGLVMLLP